MKATKKILYTEIAYFLGIILLAFATALSTMANFGLSPLSAPGYLLHIKLIQYNSLFTFGLVDVIIEILLILLTSIIVQKFKKSFIYSFITTALYGIALDVWLVLLKNIPSEQLFVRLIMFMLSVLFYSLSISLFFHTYLPSAAFEIVVKEISDKFKINIGKFKIGFDFLCLIIAIILSFVFFKELKGIGIGTVILALLNGVLINKFNKFFDNHLEFKDKFAFKKYF